MIDTNTKPTNTLTLNTLNNVNIDNKSSTFFFLPRPSTKKRKNNNSLQKIYSKINRIN